MKNFEAEKHEKRALESKVKSLTDHGTYIWFMIFCVFPNILYSIHALNFPIRAQLKKINNNKANVFSDDENVYFN